MHRYKYDMGDKMFHAATFLNTYTDRYLECHVTEQGVSLQTTVMFICFLI